MIKAATDEGILFVAADTKTRSRNIACKQNQIDGNVRL